MARNIELKAHVKDIDVLEARVRPLADKGPIEISQNDTFFRSSSGRLKLREFSEDAGELIFYQRDDERGPKECFYLRSETSQPHTVRESLSLACGVVGQVKKQRILYLVGRTRIHLDQVDSLGTFLEIEVVLRDGESSEEGEAEARSMLRQLGIEESALIDVAYIDLLSSAVNAEA